MQIKKIEDNKEAYLDLLLLGDEQENMIQKYLGRSDLWGLYDGDLKCLCAITEEKADSYEIKNLATYPDQQNRGYGSEMLKFVIEQYRPKARQIVLGTGDIDGILAYYGKFGFTYSHRVNNFFVDNYDHAMFEEGQQLVDMVYLKLEF